MEAPTFAARGVPSEDLAVELLKARLGARMFGARTKPPTIGRYRVLEELGSGGMGTVYAAHDDELDRRVAIKLLHAGKSERQLRRLRREAQSMARVVDENVAVVYEIGVHEQRPYVVMELVAGVTMRRWQAQSRAPMDIVVAYLQAARGLAAAHRFGLVHRDFKPDNVMVGSDGRVRVVDFGLARDELSTDPATPEADARGPRDAVTATGVGAGTPAYMAPEQHRGAAASPAADQFAFCVALFEALRGERPFVGNTPAELHASVHAGGGRRTPARPGEPPHVFAALVRGLAADPDERWPDMEALIAALRGRPRARHALRLIAVTLPLVVMAVWVVARLRDELLHRERVAACARVSDHSGWWNEDTRASIGAAMVATREPHAAKTTERVLPALDAYADEWSDSYGLACMAAQARLSPDRTWCFDERRIVFESLLEQLLRANPEMMTHAVDAVIELPRLEGACVETDRLAIAPSLASERVVEVAEVRRAIARTRALVTTGRWDEAVDAGTEAVRLAGRLESSLMTASARAVLGKALAKAGRYPEAESELESAYHAAREAEALELAADAAIELVHVVGVRRMRRAEALAWAQHAKSISVALAGPDGELLEARRLERVAAVHVAFAEAGPAEHAATQALAIAERILGEDHPTVGEATFTLAQALELGDWLRADPIAERALLLTEARLGDEHPDLVPKLLLLATFDGTPRQRSLVDRALTIAARSLPRDHPSLATALVGAARLDLLLGSKQVGRERLARALEIQLVKLGPRHPDVARTLNLLGMAASTDAEAVAFYERALAGAEADIGEVHPSVTFPLYNLADLRLRQGDHPGALRLMQRAIEIRARIYGETSRHTTGFRIRLPVLAWCRGDHEAVLREYGEIIPLVPLMHMHVEYPDLQTLAGASALALGDARAAVQWIRRAHTDAEHCGDTRDSYAPWRALADFVLARAVWSLPADEGGDRHEALRLARAARQRLADPTFRLHEDQCSTRERELAAVDAWLALHREERSAVTLLR